MVKVEAINIKQM